MYETFLELKTDFEKIQDTIKVTLEGGGSRTGLMAIESHSADIGLSSFPFDLTETLGTGHNVSEQVVAYDAIVLITNQHNPITALSDEQVQAIYTGKTYDWEQLGGEKGLISPLIRDENSGTQRFFEDHFAVHELAKTAEVVDHNSEIVAKVSGNKHCIGFIGFAYFTESVHNLLLHTKDSTPEGSYVAPTHRNLKNGSYPLKRGLRVYFRQGDDPAVDAFLKYLQTDRAHMIIESYGLIAAK
ncbi:phosphate ABC transporter substrate-binding protein (PhoT family) [Marinoscillum furvescens DSM 4134]|uniref:Phosphate ABC transporter substrate-binding protein (PhoT family) n=2 Tax=Marinoscillum furvescens TaxID=1026 RepID=A0A3D9LGI0_MARFU|nr:phosphate ABC transporter substrate-binding protein (PhoT family) [Marinoscillum furvescens DSM 4134]